MVVILACTAAGAACIIALVCILDACAQGCETIRRTLCTTCKGKSACCQGCCLCSFLRLRSSRTRICPHLAQQRACKKAQHWHCCNNCCDLLHVATYSPYKVVAQHQTLPLLHCNQMVWHAMVWKQQEATR